MYCPQCSQQQLSEEMRFCSRCGFPLTGIRELITAGGSLPTAPNDGRNFEGSRSMKGARRAAWIMVVSLAWTFFVGFLTAIDDDWAILLLLSVAGFVVGFGLLLYALFFQGRARRERKLEQVPSAKIQEESPAIERSAQLPPQRAVPIDTFTRPNRSTSEMIHPPSVTENTTRLLDDNESNRA